MIKIKGYTKCSKCYKKVLKNKENKLTESKLKRVIRILKKPLKEMFKIFFIFSLANIIQLILVENITIKIIGGSVKLIKSLGTESFLYYFTTIVKIGMKYYISTILLLFAIYLIINSITNKKRLSIIFTLTVLYIYSMANYIITQIRGSSLTLYDILSIKTALNVVDNMKITIDERMIISTFIFIIAILLVIYLYQNHKKINKRKRILSIVISILIVIIIASYHPIKSIKIWNMELAYQKNGVVLTLLRLASNLFYEEPKGYEKEEVEEILSNYKSNEESNYNTDTNIIVVMNESFTDYTENSNLEIYKDNIPYFHSLQNQENTITGIMHSDAFGGNTANIEYEFLTQNTVAFMPQGAIPYQQYINKPIPSIITRLKELDYTTYGMHLWKKGGYNRENIYNLLQFDDFKFVEDYDDLDYTVNGYTSDKSSYSKIKELLEKKEGTDKIFSFNLTMQNHSPYSNVDKNQIKYSDEEKLNIYLQMQNYSDKALEDLIKYLKSYEEKVVLLFFGDHQPNVGIDEVINDEENKWKVPYLIWANYDIEEKDYGDTSANYLQSMLVEVANLPKDEYTNYISDLRKQIPVLTSNYYIANDGKKYQLDDTNSPYYAKIKEYEKVSYYQLMDF